MPRSTRRWRREGAAPEGTLVGVAAVVDSIWTYQTSERRTADQAFWRGYCNMPARPTCRRGRRWRRRAAPAITFDLALPGATLARLRALASAPAVAPAGAAATTAVAAARLAAPDLIMGLLAAYLYHA